MTTITFEIVDSALGGVAAKKIYTDFALEVCKILWNAGANLVVVELQDYIGGRDEIALLAKLAFKAGWTVE